jgi:CBS domain-containing protein
MQHDEEVVEVGLLWTLGAFAGGYVAGMTMGGRPLVAAKDSMIEARTRASERRRKDEISATEPSVDVRHIREVMSSPVESVRVDSTLSEAAKAMQRHAIGDVLVVDETGKLRGIVTDRDLAIRSLAEERDPATTEIAEIMSPIGATVAPGATVSEALDRMRRHDVRRLPVVDDGRPIGIVSLGDVSRSGEAGTALADISAAPANN